MFAFVRDALRRRPAPTDTANINTTAEAPAAGAFSLRSLRSRWPLRAWSSLLPPPLLQTFATRRAPFLGLALCLVVALAATLTLALPKSSAAQEPEGEPGAQSASAQQSYTAALTHRAKTVGNAAGWLILADSDNGRWDGDWWYKQTAPPGGTCKKRTTYYDTFNSTVGTSYTIKAYDKANCNSADEIASVTIVGGVQAAWASTDTTATLSIDGHGSNDPAWWYTLNEFGKTTASCTSVAAGTTSATVTGLTPGIRYVYRTYTDGDADGDCDSADETSSRSFTTKSLTAAPDASYANRATLTIANYSSDWYYKANKAPYTACSSSAVTTGSTTLTTLAGNTAYTFKAYSDSSCNNLLATATAFTTAALSLTASPDPDSADRATLSLNHSSWYYQANKAPYTACSSSAVTTGSTTVTGLTINTAYTFKAYSDSSCNNLLATATAFTTAALSLTASPDPDSADRATLSLNHSSWYYQANKAPYTACSSSAVTTGSTTVTGLTINTAYTFKAYSDSSCNNLLATASEFTPAYTLTVTQDAFYTDRATLTIANHTGNWYFKSVGDRYATCSSSPVTGSARGLGLLTGGATYTFSAYSDSGCTTANLLATASPFTAQPVSLRAITEIKTRGF